MRLRKPTMKLFTIRSFVKYLCGMVLLATAIGLYAAGSADRPRHNVTQDDVQRWVKELSNWGRWGTNDELGTVNLITPAKRKEAAALVTTGLSISLAHDDSTLKEVDNEPPFGQQMLDADPHASTGYLMDRYSETYHGFGITHLDALCHMFYDGKFYNGFPRQSVTADGAHKLAVIHLKSGLFSRGILMDIPRLKGRAWLDPEDAIYPEDLDAWVKQTGVAIEPGDVLLIRTGHWARRDKLGPWDIGSHSAGLHASCGPWLRKHDIAILGSDAASDVLPSGVQGVPMPIHLLSLVAMGMPILDNCDLEELSRIAAQQHRWVFLLTASPEPVPMGTGSPINPIAVF
jgi:kynurenine formamidase